MKENKMTTKLSRLLDEALAEAHRLKGIRDRIDPIALDLLSACKHALKVLGPESEHPTDLVRHLKAAITNADGKITDAKT